MSEKIQQGLVDVVYTLTSPQLADKITKVISGARYRQQLPRMGVGQATSPSLDDSHQLWLAGVLEYEEYKGCQYIWVSAFAVRVCKRGHVSSIQRFVSNGVSGFGVRIAKLGHVDDEDGLHYLVIVCLGLVSSLSISDTPVSQIKKS